MVSGNSISWKTTVSTPLKRLPVAIVFVSLTLLLNAVSAPTQEAFEILLLGGKIVDGTGNPWFYGDIGIKDGRISAIGNLKGKTATQIIDVRGLTLTPGFIDLHTHAFDELRRHGQGVSEEEKSRRAAPNLVSQGVTTLVTNQDGRGGWPIAEQTRMLEKGGIGPNAILLVGHGVVRRLVMGEDFRRPSTEAEIVRMKKLVRQGLEEGAFGISAGLEYVPGRWSDTDELVALVREIVPHDGVFFEHERSSGKEPMWYLPSQDPPGQPSILDSIKESIEIAERTGATVVCTHLKSRGVKSWGEGQTVVQLIQAARDSGVSIWGDSYPYNTTGSDGDTVLIPAWARAGDNRASLKAVLRSPEEAVALRSDIAHEIARRGGADNLLILEFPDRSLVGKTIAEVAADREQSEVDTVIGLALSGFPNRPGGVRIRGFSLWESDVDVFARQSWVATASDASVALPGDGFVHPRFYGTFPRKIREYAWNRKLLTVADAVRSMTSLPAQILHLTDRGLLREGYKADVVVLDLKNLQDRATVFEPHQYASGIRHVLVNGVFVVQDSELTWTLPGKVILARRGL